MGLWLECPVLFKVYAVLSLITFRSRLSDYLGIVEAEVLVDAAQSDAQGDEQCPEEDECAAGEDDYRGCSESQGEEGDSEGQEQQDHAAGDYPAAAADAERVHVAAESDDHETVEHHPYPEDNRQHYQGDARITAQEEAYEQVQYSAHYAVAAGGEVVTAGGADYELHYAGDKHQYAEHDAEGEIALYGIAEYNDACNDGEDTGNQVQPPVADGPGGLVGHSVQKIFHKTCV